MGRRSTRTGSMILISFLWNSELISGVSARSRRLSYKRNGDSRLDRETARYNGLKTSIVASRVRGETPRILKFSGKGDKKEKKEKKDKDEDDDKFGSFIDFGDGSFSENPKDKKDAKQMKEKKAKKTASPTVSAMPSVSSAPSTAPTASHSPTRSKAPTWAPSYSPSSVPTSTTASPTTSTPTLQPTFGPTMGPSFEPTMSPSLNPTQSPAPSKRQFTSVIDVTEAGVEFLRTTCDTAKPGQTTETVEQLVEYEYVLQVDPSLINIQAQLPSIEAALHEMLEDRFMTCQYQGFDDFEVISLNSLPLDAVTGPANGECPIPGNGENCVTVNGAFTAGLFEFITERHLDEKTIITDFTIVETFGLFIRDAINNGTIFEQNDLLTAGSFSAITNAVLDQSTGTVTPEESATGDAITGNQDETPEKGSFAVTASLTVVSAVALLAVVGVLAFQRRRRERGKEHMALDLDDFEDEMDESVEKRPSTVPSSDILADLAEAENLEIDIDDQEMSTGPMEPSISPSMAPSLASRYPKAYVMTDSDAISQATEELRFSATAYTNRPSSPSNYPAPVFVGTDVRKTLRDLAPRKSPATRRVYVADDTVDL